MKHLIHPINHITIYAIILLITGLLIRYIIGRRRFNRRSIAGLQLFNSYNHSVIVTTVEKVFNLISALLIIGAVILYLIR